MLSRLGARLVPAWRAALTASHGLHALSLGHDPEAVNSRIPLVWPLRLGEGERPRLQGAVVTDLHAWPFQPGSLDAVFWRLEPGHLPWLSVWLHEIVSLLGSQGRLVIWAEASTLTRWVRVGTPLCELLDLRLLSDDWADGRRFTLLPPALAGGWRSGLQQWLPFVAHGTVQCWKKEVPCGAAGYRTQPVPRQVRWHGAPATRSGSVASKQ